MSRVPISACIVAMNEADRIGACLASVAFCDEIVVLDSGSTDDTVALCEAAGARVIQTDWPGYVAQKNRATQAATHDWILSVDADERVDESLRGAIQALQANGLADERGPRGYEVKRKVWYLGRWIRHGGWYPEWRVRLYDRRRAKWGGVDPHDKILLEGERGRIPQGDLEHFTYRSVSDHLQQMDRFTTIGANELFARGKRGGFFAMLTRPPWRFLRMYLLRLGFLDGRAGLALACLDAQTVFQKYLKLWRLSEEEREPGDRA